MVNTTDILSASIATWRWFHEWRWSVALVQAWNYLIDREASSNFRPVLIYIFTLCCRPDIGLYDCYVAEVPHLQWISFLGKNPNCPYAEVGPDCFPITLATIFYHLKTEIDMQLQHIARMAVIDYQMKM